MTPYEQGFMDKCAELGVDPNRLLKRAGLLRILSADVRPAGAAIRRGSKRFLELLLGGNKSLRSAYADTNNVLYRVWGKTGSRGTPPQVVRDAIDELRRINLRGKGLDVTAPFRRVLEENPHAERIIGLDISHGLSDTHGVADAIMDTERAKVLAARLGAAAGVGGTVYGVGKAISDKTGN